MSSNLLEKLLIKQQNGEDTDCTFILTESDKDKTKIQEVIIHGHRAVLSCASPVFNAMLKDEWSGDKPIKIREITPVTFKKLLQLIYINYAVVDNADEAIELYKCSLLYGLEDGTSVISKILLERFLTVDTVIPIANLACLHDDVPLKDACTEIFRANATAILAKPEFTQLAPSIVNFIFQLNPLNINSENELLKALENYVLFQNADVPDIKDQVRKAKNSIRFLTLTEKEIDACLLLTDFEKDHLKMLKKNKPSSIVSSLSSSQIQRAKVNQKKEVDQKLFLSTLPGEVLLELYIKFSNQYCWFCKVDHSAFDCKPLQTAYGFYADLGIIYRHYGHSQIHRYSNDYVKNILQIFSKNADNAMFAKFKNI